MSFHVQNIAAVQVFVGHDAGDSLSLQVENTYRTVVAAKYDFLIFECHGVVDRVIVHEIDFDSAYFYSGYR